MFTRVKLIDSSIIMIIGLLSAALGLLVIQFMLVTFLSQKILTTTKSQYFISTGSAALNETYLSLLEIESAARGYLLTKDRRYLDPYFRAKSTVHASITKLSENTSNNAEWEKQFQKIIPLIMAKINYIEEVISKQDDGNVESVKKIVSEQFGNRTMDQIRTMYGEFDASLRSARTNIARLNRQNQKYLLWIQASIDLLLIILIFTATCLGLKNLKVYRGLNAALNTDSTTDTLTKLADRRLFLVWASLALARTHRGESGLAIFFIDLNGFKKINDTFGHQAGDEILQTVSIRMTTSMRSSDFLARLGGDEFAILISGKITKAGLLIFQKTISDSISSPILTGTMKGKLISASIGFAIYPENGTTIETLLAAADADMYANKQSYSKQKLSLLK